MTMSVEEFVSKGEVGDVLSLYVSLLLSLSLLLSISLSIEEFVSKGEVGAVLSLSVSLSHSLSSPHPLSLSFCLSRWRWRSS